MFEYVRLHLHLEFEKFISPYFIEALLRGAMGFKLKKLICINKTVKNCKECFLRKECSYALIYYSEIDDENVKLDIQTAQPPINFFVYRKGVGQNQFIELTIFKKLINYFDHIVYTLYELSKEGIGRERVKFQIKSIKDSISGNEIFDGKKLNEPEIRCVNINLENAMKTIEENSNVLSDKKEITIEFVTPMRIKRNNRFLNEIPFFELIKSAFLRYGILSEIYGNDDIDKEVIKRLIEKAKEVSIVSKELRWQKHLRFSSSQRSKISVSGIVGIIIYSGDIEPFMEILDFGGKFGIGKSTSFGCGRYIVYKD